MKRPEVNRQGVAIIERDADGGVFWIMTPDGDVSTRVRKSEAETVVRLWAKKHAQPHAINLVKVEWRNL